MVATQLSMVHSLSSLQSSVAVTQAVLSQTWWKKVRSSHVDAAHRSPTAAQMHSPLDEQAFPRVVKVARQSLQGMPPEPQAPALSAVTHSPSMQQPSAQLWSSQVTQPWSRQAAPGRHSSFAAAVHTQAPARQASARLPALVAQWVAQSPQWEKSRSRSAHSTPVAVVQVSLVPHAPCVSGTQAASTQTWMPVQGWPHPPQCACDQRVSTQLPSQHRLPVGHAVASSPQTHQPSEQSSTRSPKRAAQSVPQAPQLAESLASAWQKPSRSQRVSFTPQRVQAASQIPRQQPSSSGQSASVAHQVQQPRAHGIVSGGQ
jgi:hypothetical protein